MSGFLRTTQKSGKGRITNIASISSFVAFHEVSAYGVSKAVFLASDAASFITGQSIVVDGGFLASGVNS